MELRTSIRPNKKNMTWYERLGFGGVFKDTQIAYKFALRESKAREFVISVWGCEDQGNNIVLMKNKVEEKVVKRKVIELLITRKEKAVA